MLAKRLWHVLRVSFLMMRKGLVSKRKLIMDINLLIKRGSLLRKSLGKYLIMISHNHHHHQQQLSSMMVSRGSFGIQEYEFSCSNSPNPVFFHVSKHKYHCFPCINLPEVIEEKEEEEEEEEEADYNNNMAAAAAVMVVPKTPEYAFNFNFGATGEKRSPLLSPPISVRVSNFSSEEYEGDENDVGGNGKVDDEAEEFIRKFYEQLRSQRRRQLLQY